MAKIKIIKPYVLVESPERPTPIAEIIKMERTEIKDLASGLGVRARVVTVWALVERGGNLLSEHATRREALAALHQYRVNQ